MSVPESVSAVANTYIITVTYTLQLPTNLPPAHRGRAFRFSYDFVVSLSVALPGGGDRQKSKDIVVPIRIWANVSRT